MNKKKILLVVILFNLKLYSQNLKELDKDFILSKYEKIDSLEEGQKLRTILNLNKDAVIIRTNGSNPIITISNSGYSCYYVCNNEIINSFTLNSTKSKMVKQIIDSITKLNPSELLNEFDEKGLKYQIQDCEEYNKVEIFKNNKKLNLNSYCTWFYIEKKCNFYEKRKMFLDYYNILNSFFEDEEYDRIKKLDTIYIVFEQNKNQFKYNNKKGANQLEFNFYYPCFQAYFYMVNSINEFRLYNYKKGEQYTNEFYVDKKFLNAHHDKIISLDKIKKYSLNNISLLINSDFKNVFIIDKDESKKNKSKIIKVIGGVFKFN